MLLVIILVTAIISLLVPCLFYYVQFYKPYSYFRRRGIPGPKPQFLFGNLLDYENKFELRHESITINAQKYGKIYGIFYGKLPVLHIADLDMVQEVLITQSSHFINRLSFISSNKMIVSLYHARDETWKQARENLSPLFSSSSLQDMMSFINYESKVLLEDVVTIGNSCNWIVDVKKLCYKAAMKISMASIFGAQWNAQCEASILEDNLSDILGSSADVTFALSIAMPSVMKYFFKLFTDRKSQAVIDISKVLQKIVDDRRKEIDQSDNKSSPTDILTLLLRTDNENKVSNNVAMQYCLTFLINTYGASASLLVFVCYTLATRPQAQSKVIAEIDDKCPHQHSLNYVNISKLTYLDMIINETIRLYSPSFVHLREVKDDCTIKGIQLSKGTGVAIAVKAIHHDPTIWSDPQKFIPERFLPESVAKRHRCGFLPFSEGPRSCIGGKLGLLIVKATLARLLQKIKFAVAEKTDIPLPIITQSTLVPAGPVYLRIKCRK